MPDSVKINNHTALRWSFIYSLIPHFARDNKRSLLFLVLILVANAFLGAVDPIIMRNVTDEALFNLNPTLILSLLLYCLVNVAAIVVQSASTVITSKMGYSMGYALRVKVFHEALREWTIDYSAGELMNRLTSDCEAVSRYIINYIPSLISNLMHIVVNFSLLIWLDKIFGMLTLLSFPVLLVITKYFAKDALRLNEESREQSGLLMHFTQHIFSSLPMVIGSRIQNKVQYRYEENLAAYNAINLSANYVGIRNNLWVSLTNVLFRTVFFVVGIISVATHRLTYGSFFALFSLGNRVMSQVNFFANIPMRWAQVVVSLDRMAELCGRESRILVISSPGEELFVEAHNEPLAHGGVVSFHFGRGEHLGIKGRTGVGKTTLAMKIAGIIPVENQMTWRGLVESDIMYLPASRGVCPILTLRDNLGGSSNNHEIENTLNLVGMNERWLESGLDYDAPMIDIVAQMSSGEQQRLAIGRAYLQKPKLLILDEAISNIDSKSAVEILHSLTDKMGDSSAVVIISHREDDFCICHRVIEIGGDTQV
ncbi:MAG: ABC transporter ATP-binding protein/permease [Symbiobacteriaceae bacterium]|nr:ABC transporter ATP-binding protein/permease [Symbiobacteriaceae bacterium]